METRIVCSCCQWLTPAEYMEDGVCFECMQACWDEVEEDYAPANEW